MATHLIELLAERGIRPKRFTAGHSEKLRCPKCDGGRTGESSLSLTIDADGQGATWQCHRGSCGWCSGERLNHRGDDGHRSRGASGGGHHATCNVDNRPVHDLAARETTYQNPRPHSPEQIQNRPDWLYRVFADRNIGARTVNAFDIYIVRRWFSEIGEADAIVFPYFHRGALVNRKYRPHPHKSPQLQERGALPTLFNIDRLGDAPEEVIFVEGEPDVLALFECGIPHAVTLKDGAPAQVGAGNDKRFEALRTHAAVLGKVKRFILAGDMDAPGLAWREELARRLGRHRCLLVTWPAGCKDACDVLRAHGPDAVGEAIKNAVPYPIEGLQDITPGSLLNLRHSPPPPLLTTGTRATDEVMRLPGEGRLIVVTGIPNHGKSSWVTFAMVHVMRQHDRCFVAFSPEMQPWEEYVALCAQILVGRPFRPSEDAQSLSDREIVGAENWLRPRLTLLVSDAEDQAPTLDWILSRARTAVLRSGATDLLIDPWNELEFDRGGMSETDHIGRSLQKLKAFALRHGVNVWIVAHPTKQFPAKPGQALDPPGLYEISGSAHWSNKTDLGITVHNRGDRTEIHLTKARFARWGRRGTCATIAFDPKTSRYYDIADPPPMPTDLGRGSDQ